MLPEMENLAEVSVKLMPETLPLTVTVWLGGLKVEPPLVGVTE